jgi:carboxyl-terminal processing protease
VHIAADGFHAKIIGGLTARDGDELGPLEIELTRVAADDRPATEFVGIGLHLRTDGDVLSVFGVMPDSGAADAGVKVGDVVVAIDGEAAASIGFERVITRTYGAPGSTVTLTLRRGGRDVPILVERRRLWN